ncbi:MAG: tetratricopeptide repeat protein [Cyanobacteriota bacterium]|nr:tetratricopeptide repeat protein [Cyanobacteriota bacterium]
MFRTAAIDDLAVPEVSHANLQAYQRLQLSLFLGLRRQLWIATCDDVQLRDRLAEQLHKDVEPPNQPSRLVSLELNLENPAFLAQIAQWLKQHPDFQNHQVPLTFQILGIEGLTRQPASQRRFEKHLQAMSRHLPQLNVNLLLWLSRPWVNKIQQSVPEFWRWRTGVFAFSGEVTVPPHLRSAMDVLKRSIQVPERVEWNEGVSSGQSLFPGEGAFPLIRLLDSPPRDGESGRAGERETGRGGDGETGRGGDGERGRAGEGEMGRGGDGESGRAGEREMGRAGDGVVAKFDESGTTENPSSSVVENGNGKTAMVPASPRSFAQLEQLERQQALSPEALATAYLELGDRYRDAIAVGNTSLEVLSTAIQSYERGLQWSDEVSSLSDILNDLGNFYWMRSRCWQELQPALGDLEQAIQYYQEAIARVEEGESSPTQYAKIQNNLGAAYSDLARYGDSAGNLQRSIEAYQEALRHRPQELDPLKYGSTQNNLGTAYWHLAQQQNPTQNLRAAIAAYQEALAQYHPETASMQWAMIQNNLGTAYWNLAQREEPEVWLERAIECYSASLRYRTAETAPAACAATQNNLGTAYWHWSFSEMLTPQRQLEYLERAIAAYSVAAAIAEELSLKNPPVFVSFDLVAAYNNLGSIRVQIATNEAFSLPSAVCDEHLEAALQAHLKALSIATPQADSHTMSFNGIIATVRLFYQSGGSAAQNRALSLIPARILPSIMERL